MIDIWGARCVSRSVVLKYTLDTPKCSKFVGFMVDLSINETLCTSTVRKPCLPWEGESVYLFLSFTINETEDGTN